MRNTQISRIVNKPRNIFSEETIMMPQQLNSKHLTQEQQIRVLKSAAAICEKNEPAVAAFFSQLATKIINKQGPAGLTFDDIKFALTTPLVIIELAKVVVQQNLQLRDLSENVNAEVLKKVQTLPTGGSKTL